MVGESVPGARPLQAQANALERRGRELTGSIRRQTSRAGYRRTQIDRQIDREAGWMGTDRKGKIQWTEAVKAHRRRRKFRRNRQQKEEKEDQDSP